MKRLTLALVAAAALLVAVPAAATEVTREAFVAEVEPICKANTEANEKILEGVRSKVRGGQLGAAGKQFERAAKALKRTLAELKAVPQPPADSPKLDKWLGYVKAEVDLFQQVADKLAAGDRAGAQRTVVRLARNTNRANNEVLGFEFTYCRFEPSKFT